MQQITRQSSRSCLQTKHTNCNRERRSGGGALLDEEVLEGGADRVAVRLFLLLVPAREPTGDLTGA